MGYSQHSRRGHRLRRHRRGGAKRIERVLWNDPATGVMRHADAGYDDRRRLRARAGPEPADGALMLLQPRTPDAGRTAGHPCRRPPLLIDPRRRCRHPGQRRRGAARRRGDAPVYGVNTGFGKLASTRISADDLATLQRNLIRSHSVGVGEPLPPPVVRLMLALKAASLARGHSGVRPVVIDTLLAVHNAGLVPCVPSQGSVGASGDLAPLSHMTLALMGEGELRRRQRRAGAERAGAPGHRAADAGRPRKAWR
jgi:hypothetical protein